MLCHRKDLDTNIFFQPPIALSLPYVVLKDNGVECLQRYVKTV